MLRLFEIECKQVDLIYLAKKVAACVYDVLPTKCHLFYLSSYQKEYSNATTETTIEPANTPLKLCRLYLPLATWLASQSVWSCIRWAGTKKDDNSVKHTAAGTGCNHFGSLEYTISF